MSVETPITVGTFLLIHALTRLVEPKIFISIHSKGNFSERSTNFVAAACITISGLVKFKQSFTDSMFETSKGTTSQFVKFLTKKFCLLFRAPKKTLYFFL